MSYGNDLIARLLKSRWWLLAQFAGTLAVAGLGLLWTRLGEKHIWQVLLSLLLPVLLAAGLLALEAGAMRRLAGVENRPRAVALAALGCLAWLALGWALWALLDKADDHILEWASYLNSRFSAKSRATVFTFEHLQIWMNWLEWALRWMVVPGIAVASASATAVEGWRRPWRRLGRVLLNWRWWPAVAVAAFFAVWLPGWLFSGEPHGTVKAQVWRVVLKSALVAVLMLGSWIKLLGWAAVLLGRGRAAEPPVEE